MKLQKELSQRMDALSLTSQDSMSRLPGTWKRFGGTMSRLANPDGLETASPKRNDAMQQRQVESDRHQTRPFSFPGTLSAAEMLDSQVGLLRASPLLQAPEQMPFLLSLSRHTHSPSLIFPLEASCMLFQLCCTAE